MQIPEKEIVSKSHTKTVFLQIFFYLMIEWIKRKYLELFWYRFYQLDIQMNLSILFLSNDRMTFFIPFCCSIGKLCLLNFLFSLSLIPILILAKIQKREIYLKTSFQDFFHWKKKTSSLFHFSSTCTICTCVYTQPQIVSEMRKSFWISKSSKFSRWIYTSSLSICKNTFGKPS